MKQLTRYLVLALTLQLVPLCLSAAENDGTDINSKGRNFASRSLETAGLKMDWFTQLDLSIDGKIVDMQMVVDENDSTTFFSIEFGRRKEIISHKALSPFGKPFGIEDAQEYAEIRRDVIQKHLDAAGKKITAKINRYTIPRTTIFALTDSGLVNAINADTGKIIWSTYVGSYEQPSVGIGANAKYVAAVNGAYVYCLDARDGKVLFQRKCMGIAAASPAVGFPLNMEDPEEGVEGFVFVPLRRGSVQMFPINLNGMSHKFERAVGNATARPLITNDSISWPTRRGHYNVVLRPKSNGIHKGGLDYRLKSFGEMVAPGKFLNGNLYVTSRDGFVYSIKEKTGVLNWDFSTGEEVSQPAFPINDSVYVITDNDELFRLDAAEGGNSKGWEQPLRNVHSFVGASKTRLYLIDTLGRLVSLDLASKQILTTTEIGEVSFLLPNYLTDRLYVGFGNGRLQCLRELGADQPHYHSTDMPETKADSQQPVQPKETRPAVPDQDDPFKTFDAPATKKADGGDPFADDPFSTNKSKKDDETDPFKK